MNRTKLPNWLIWAILLPALLALYPVFQRHRVEARNKATAIVTEYETVEALAAAEGLELAAAIDRLKAAGLNGLVLSEETVGDLITQGRATLGAKVFTAGEGEGIPISSLTFADPREIERVRRGLQIRLGPLTTPSRSRADILALPPLSANFLRGIPIGLAPGQATLARESGLLIVGRHGNPVGVTGEAARATLAWSKELGTSIFLPSGEQVLGRRDALKATEQAISELGLLYASPEFTKIGGDANMVAGLPGNVVRLHSAQSAELDRLPNVDAVDRYARAARERNMHVLLIRPISAGADRPLESFAEFVGAIRNQVVAEGGGIAAPRPFDEIPIPRFFPILLGLSLVPAVWFAASAFVASPRLRQVGAALLVLLGLACAVRTGQTLMALLASVAMPVVAFLVIDALRPRNLALGLLIASLVSLVGGLAVTGLLSGRPGLVGAEHFAGVKLAVFLPVLIVGLLFVMRLRNLKELLKDPITWGAAALGVGVLVVLLVLVARSGNDSGVGASGPEMMVRNLLDRFLYVRPRTKEFMIGHPALIVALGMLSTITRRPSLATKWGGWTALMLMIGAIGQTGIVNTLCHLHIPLELSFARIFLGMAIGCMIGLGVWALVSRMIPAGEDEA